MKKLILYHGSCCDGFASAFVAWKYFKNYPEEVRFQEVYHGDPLPDVLTQFEGMGFDECTDVYILDFSYSAKQIRELANKIWGEVTILDHHVSAQKTLIGPKFPPNVTIKFDMNKSGVGITWEHFFGDKEMPFLLKAVQDRDLWNWKEPYTREILAALDTYPREFDEWDGFLDESCQPEIHAHMRSVGKTIVDLDQRRVESILDNAGTVRFEGQTVPCIVMACSDYLSDVANQLVVLHNAPFAVILKPTKGAKVISLRSLKGGYDVSEIASQYGGGGHQSAAGFQNDDVFDLLVRRLYNL